ncbi:hypothetical protein N0V88_003947 [Collariella sp. IMI 366227]|nr:hypothetical protein N0V88_003947 [Collariella sp. IMI 366227]
MIGKQGFPRNHINGADNDFVWLIPPNGRPDGKVIHPDDKIARPSQRKMNDVQEFPRLDVAPSDFVAIQYSENGHVSRADSANQFKPINRGTVYLYGTTDNDLTDVNLVDVHLKWTADGKGGNGKGKLLATRHYDDGQCHEVIPDSGDIEEITTYRKEHVSKADSLMCQSDLQIPGDITAGQVLTVIWVWDWPDMNIPGVAVPPASYQANSSESGQFYVKMPEIYTGVVDFNIVDPCDDKLGAVKGPTCENPNVKVAAQFIAQQDASTRGIRSQMENPFLVKVPQADPSVTTATADPRSIPVHGLIGLAVKPKFPLADSFMAGQDQAFDGPTTAAESVAAPTPSASSSNGQATNNPATSPTTVAPPLPTATTIPKGDGSGMVTVTVTVPRKVSTVTVVRAPASQQQQQSSAVPQVAVTTTTDLVQPQATAIFSTRTPLRVRGRWYR